MNIKSNNSKYFIHIGPPKTATTSLQKYFLNLSSNNIIYDGILQPRTKDDETVCKRLYNTVIKSTKSQDNYNKDFLNFRPEHTTIRILSEEMFLVDSKSTRWQEKMNSLYIITEQLNPTVLIVIRNPIDAIRSYYQELYYALNKAEIMSINDFAESNYCTIYNYNVLVQTLNEIGFKKIKLLDFDKLINNRYKINDVLDVNDYKTITLNKNNSSITSKSSYYANNSNLKRVIRHSIPDSLYKIIEPNIMVRKFMSFLIPDIEISKGIKLNIDLNKEIQDLFMGAYYSALKDTV